MSRGKIIFWYLFIILFSVSLSSVLTLGFYPVAVVEGKIITARELEFNSKLAYIYFESFLRDYLEDISTKLHLTYQDFEAPALNSLIERILIDNKLKEELGDMRVDNLIKLRLSQIEQDSSYAEIAGLYDSENLKKTLIIPQIKREILINYFGDNKNDFDKWLKEKKKKSKIYLFLRHMQWNGQEIISKK